MMGHVADTYEREGKTTYDKDDLMRFKFRLSEKLYRSGAPVHYVLVPMNINNDHWGMIVAREVATNTWEMYWGDSLGIKCGGHRMLFAGASISSALGKEIHWIYKKENYMLDVLGYKEQRDGYSCGAYCISLMSQYSRTHGFMPKGTFKGKYDARLTEKIRWACARARVELIIWSAAYNPLNAIMSNEFTVSSDHDAWRKRCYNWRRSMEGKQPRETPKRKRGAECGKSILSSTGDGTTASQIAPDDNRNDATELNFVHDAPPCVAMEGLKRRRLNTPQKADPVIIDVDDQDKTCSVRKDVSASCTPSAIAEGLKGAVQIDSCVSNASGGFCSAGTTAGDAVCEATKDSAVLNLVASGPNKKAHNASEAGPGGTSTSAPNGGDNSGCASGPAPNGGLSNPPDPSAAKSNSPPLIGVSAISKGSHDREEKKPQSSFGTECTKPVTTGKHARKQSFKQKKSFPKPHRIRMKHEMVDRFVKDLPKFVGDEARKGYSFGLHNYRPLAKRKKYVCNLRIRCLMYKSRPKGSQCTASYIAKLHSDLSGWALNGTNVHNHDADSTAAKEWKARMEAVRSGIAAKLPTDVAVKYVNYNVPSSRKLLSSDQSQNDSKLPRVRPHSDKKEIHADHENVPASNNGNYSGGQEDESEHEVLCGRDSDTDSSSDQSNSPICDTHLASEECARNACGAYLSASPVSPNDDILKHIQYIYECYGYQLVIRDSLYNGDPPSKRLSRAFLVCSRHEEEDLKCPFKLVVRTTRAEADTVNSKQVYYGDWSRAFHNHGPAVLLLKRRVPPEMMKEAQDMYMRLRLSYKDILKLLEDKNRITIDRDVFRHRLRYFTDLRNPKERECAELYRVLSQLQDEEANTKTFFCTKKEGTLQYVAWTFEDWIDDYYKFGIVPGVSLDCKSLSNRFGMPLIAINGRDNDGSVLTYFMGFIANETTESFEWALEKFKTVVNVSPAIVAVDQSASLIAAIRKVFPASYITLDDWHLNKNQLLNASRWCNIIGRSTWSSQLVQDLHHLRASSTVESFHRRRQVLERKYFQPFLSREKPFAPRWYRFLYHDNPTMVMTCYKNRLLPRRFYFQGSGYTESFNSSYRNFILKDSVPFSKVPLEMRNVTRRRREERRKKSQKGLSKALQTSQQPLPASIIDAMLQNLTSYSITKFIERSIVRSTWYRVTNVWVENNVTTSSEAAWVTQLHADPPSIPSNIRLCFFRIEWCSSNGPGNEITATDALPPIKTYTAFFYRQQLSNDSIVLRGLCSCASTAVHGIPCTHITRIATVYAEMAERNEAVKCIIGVRFPIEHFFHRYWHKTSAFWSINQIVAERSKMGTGGEQIKADLEQGIEQSDQIRKTNMSDLLKGQSLEQFVDSVLSQRRKEFESYTLYSDLKGLCDQMHRVAKAHGPSMQHSLKEYFRIGLQMMNQGHHPTNPGTVMPPQRSLLTLEPGKVMDSEAIAGIQNPNSGLCRVEKRKKSAGERVSRKRETQRKPQSGRKDVSNRISSENGTPAIDNILERAVEFVADVSNAYNDGEQ